MRRYGLYANGARRRLAIAREHHAQADLEAERPQPVEWQDLLAASPKHAERGRCRQCGAPLKLAERIEPVRGPPRRCT